MCKHKQTVCAHDLHVRRRVGGAAFGRACCLPGRGGVFGAGLALAASVWPRGGGVAHVGRSLMWVARGGGWVLVFG